MLHLRKSQELTIRYVAARLLASGNRNYAKDYASSSDDEKKPKKSKEKVEKALEKEQSSPSEESASAKLNRLLASMQTADDMNFTKRADIVVKPGEGNKKKKLQQKQVLESKDIFAAAKKVASMLGDEKQQQQQTESELLSRLLGGKPNQKATKTSEEEQKKPIVSNEAEISLSELIVGMKIDRRQQQKDTTRSDYVRRSLAAKGKQQQRGKYQQDFSRNKQQQYRKREAELFTGSVNLFGSKPLGIFNDPTELQNTTNLLPTWSYLQEQALMVQVAHPPANYFDKLATWTEQGKVWRFPIDNEQDWLDEKDVDFSEHIFLEQHLEGWCPNRGPVRHFMELVCVGLSKNPYITAKEKKDHIMWYREYFESKRDILKELMDKEPDEETKSKVAGGGDAKQKQVEA